MIWWHKYQNDSKNIASLKYIPKKNQLSFQHCYFLVMRKASFVAAADAHVSVDNIITG